MDGFPAPGKRRTYLTRFQKSPQFVAPLRLDLVVLKNVEMFGIVFGSGRQSHLTDPLQTSTIEPCQFSAPLDCRVVGCQSKIQNRGLQVIQARVEPPAHDLAVRAAAVIAKLDQALVNIVAIGHHRPAVSQARQRLGREKADDTGHAETSRRAPFKPRAQRLRRVFYNRQPTTFGDAFERPHIRRAPV